MNNKTKINKNRLGVCHTFKDPKPNDLFLANPLTLKDLGIQQKTRNTNNKIPLAELPNTELIRFDSSKFI